MSIVDGKDSLKKESAMHDSFNTQGDETQGITSPPVETSANNSPLQNRFSSLQRPNPNMIRIEK